MGDAVAGSRCVETQDVCVETQGVCVETQDVCVETQDVEGSRESETLWRGRGVWRRT